MSWVCPHNDETRCLRRRQQPCEPGAAGCVLHGKVIMTPSDQNSGADTHLQERRGRLIRAMQDVFNEDARRVDHAMTVLEFAERILAQEPAADTETVVTAAILHDIGIPEAERKHQSAAGHLQEVEGPPIAREIMDRLGIDHNIIDHVCRIIANHHSARNIDTPEFRIIWDADWLVNLPHVYPDLSQPQMEHTIQRIFKTSAGAKIARSLWLNSDR